MFIEANRDVFFDLSEVIPIFNEYTKAKHDEFNIINVSDKMLVIVFHKTLMFSVFGLNLEELEKLKNTIRKDLKDESKIIIKIPKLNENMRMYPFKGKLIY